MNTWRAARLIFFKELRVEYRTGEVLITSGLFAALVTVLASFSLYLDRESASLAAPGVIWIASAFAGITAMSRSWSREREHEVIQALFISPIPRSAVYLGKTAGSLVFLAAVELIILALVGILFHVDLSSFLAPLGALLFLGALGFCATGNLFAAMTVRTRSRDLALAAAVFPLTAPALLCGVVATRELLMGAPAAEIVGWMRILAAFDLIAIASALLLFEPLTAE